LNYFCPNDSIHRASNELNTGIIVIETRIKEVGCVQFSERGEKKRRRKGKKEKEKEKHKKNIYKKNQMTYFSFFFL
jgi:hypothetical protein